LIQESRPSLAIPATESTRTTYSIDPLRMFLHLGWDGVYMDAIEASAKIRESFSLADQIVPTVMVPGRLPVGDRLMIVGSDFYGSYWSAPGKSRSKERSGSKGPAEVLTEVL